VVQEEPKVLATLPVHSRKDEKTRTHVLRVDGLVGQCLELTLADLEGLPQQDLTDDFTCLEGWTVPNLKWRGVRWKLCCRSRSQVLRPIMSRQARETSAFHYLGIMPNERSLRSASTKMLCRPSTAVRFASLFRVANVSRP